jgi:hypothetical protein
MCAMQVLASSAKDRLTPSTLTGSRFFSYSRRVRTLSWSSTRVTEIAGVSVDPHILHVWAQGQAELFPRLCQLDLTLYTHTDAAAMLGFLTRSITRIMLRFSPNCPNPLARIAPADLAHMLAQASRLTDIQCTAPNPPEASLASRTALMSGLVCASTQLRSVGANAAVTPEAYEHLLTCPDLRTLSVQSALPDSFPSPSHEHASVVLEQISVEESHPSTRLLTSVIDFLAHQTPARLTRLRTVGLQTHNASGAELALIRRIPAVLGAYTALTAVFLSLYMMPDAELGLASSPAENWQIFAPLTKLHALNRISLLVNFALELAPLAFRDTMAAWPWLQEWRVVAREPRSGKNKRTLSVVSVPILFGILARCPRLLYIPAAVGGPELPSEAAIVEMEKRRHPFVGPLHMHPHHILTSPTNPRLGEAVKRALPNVRRYVAA